MKLSYSCSYEKLFSELRSFLSCSACILQHRFYRMIILKHDDNHKLLFIISSLLRFMYDILLHSLQVNTFPHCFRLFYSISNGLLHLPLNILLSCSILSGFSTFLKQLLLSLLFQLLKSSSEND